MVQARFYNWMNLLFLVITLAVNAASNAIPLGGQTTGEISDRYPVLITPASYTFMIWGVIYLFLIGFVLYGFFGGERGREAVNKAGLLFVITCILNCVWLLLWHNEQLSWTVGVMCLLLLTLIVLYRRTRLVNPDPFSPQFWFRSMPFSLYLGWICVATIVNVSVLLFDLNWNGWGLRDEIWTVIMLSAAAILAVIIGYMNRDSYVVLVFLWAFIGIGVMQADIVLIAGAAYMFAALLAIIAIAISWLFARTGRTSAVK